MAPLLSVERRWECPNCEAVKVTREGRSHTPFHPCRGLSGLMAPLVEAGTRCKVVAVEREDYVGSERGVLVDDSGRAIMSVVTVRDDGQDCAVLAPSATARREG